MKDKSKINQFCVNCKNYVPVTGGPETGKGTCSVNFTYNKVTGAKTTVTSAVARANGTMCGPEADDYK